MCADPATLAAIAAASQVAMTAGEGVAGYMQGKATEKAYKNAAQQELINTATEESGMRRKMRKFSARQRVQALRSGGDVASGSLAEIAAEDTETMELNALMRRYAGEVEAENLQFQGRSEARSGAIGGAFKFMQAGAEAIGADARGDFDAFKRKKAA